MTNFTTGGANKICDRLLTKYTKAIANINVIAPIASVILSWAADGLKNILTLISCQLDSDHELYKPDDQS